jgi:DNA mismatch endonuclease (patch repair protein)
MALTRSEQMARIRGSDTSPELELRRALDALGVAYSAHAKTPVGRPDLVFPDARVAVFIGGCY